MAVPRALSPFGLLALQTAFAQFQGTFPRDRWVEAIESYHHTTDRATVFVVRPDTDQNPAVPARAEARTKPTVSASRTTTACFR